MRFWIIPVCAAALVFVMGDSYASHSTSQPCNVYVRGEILPVTYDGDPRNNPDKTFYPGDAFYYLIRYSASPTCISLRVDPLRASDGLELTLYEHISKGNTAVLRNADVPEYVDPESLSGFANKVSSKCSVVQRYSGCVVGMATIGDIDGECPEDSERCIHKSAKLVQKVIGIKKVCNADSKCKRVPVVRTATLTPDILMPDLDIVLTKETILDADGYAARNIDGTYYLWDPIVVRHVPDLEWKNHRSNTIHFETVKTPDSSTVRDLGCYQNSCSVVLEHPRITASTWNLGNGDDITMYNATDSSRLGRNLFAYDVTVINAGLIIDSDSDATDALLVLYRPEYSQYPYSALHDDYRTSYENRAAVALHYFGSLGGGPDDRELLHEDRRSKINEYYYYGVGFDPWNPVPFNRTLTWDEVRDVGIMPHHKDVSEARYDGVVASSSDLIPCEAETHGTAMLVRAGYCGIYFGYPILDAVIGPGGPRYENATLFNTLISKDFAGKDRTYLLHYEYRFPEPFFNTNLYVESVVGNTTNNIPLLIEVMPGSQTISEYLDEKVTYDSGDAGFGEIISDDTYLVNYTESGTGQVEIKLRRISSEFEVYRDKSQDVAGLGIADLSALYLDNSVSARLEIPLDVGLGALSPVVVDVTAQNVTVRYDYDYVDFGPDMEIIVNVAQDNTLDVIRNPGSITVTTQPGFGNIEEIYVDGVAVDAECSSRCTISVPGGSAAEITAKNIWGGTARGTAPELMQEEVPPAHTTNIQALVFFVLLLPLLYWVYRRITKR